ncbi:hypothetical protein NQ318_010820, partial [Aromia moschata]
GSSKVVVIMNLAVVLLVWLGIALAEERVRYDGYKVYQVIATTVDEAETLNKLKDNAFFDFWAAPRALNLPVTVMVSPSAQASFESDLKAKSTNYSVLINDVENSIQEEVLRQRASPRVARGAVSFTHYMRYYEMTDYLQSLVQAHPRIASLVNLGKSFEGRDILGVRISSGGSGKTTIFIDAGIHAREWIAPPVALYIIHQLVENPENAALYRDIDWVQRLWRKIRSPNTLCYGVDPNRNFDYYWMLTGASDNQCSEIFAGPRPFSEPETSALRDYLLAHHNEVKLYLTFHSYGQFLLYPWGYSSDLPHDNDELYALGALVDDAISSVAGTRYIIGSSTNVLYAAAGGSDDYVKGLVGVDLSYTIELPGGGLTGFNPAATRILPIVQETWEGIKAYHQYIENKFVH